MTAGVNLYNKRIKRGGSQCHLRTGRRSRLALETHTKPHQAGRQGEGRASCRGSPGACQARAPEQALAAVQCPGLPGHTGGGGRGLEALAPAYWALRPLGQASGTSHRPEHAARPQALRPLSRGDLEVDTYGDKGLDLLLPACLTTGPGQGSHRPCGTSWRVRGDPGSLHSPFLRSWVGAGCCSGRTTGASPGYSAAQEDNINCTSREYFFQGAFWPEPHQVFLQVHGHAAELLRPARPHLRFRRGKAVLHYQDEQGECGGRREKGPLPSAPPGPRLAGSLQPLT